MQKVEAITFRSPKTTETQAAFELTFFDEWLALGFAAAESVKSQCSCGHIALATNEAVRPLFIDLVGLFEDAHAARFGGSADEDEGARLDGPSRCLAWPGAARRAVILARGTMGGVGGAKLVGEMLYNALNNAYEDYKKKVQ